MIKIICEEHFAKTMSFALNEGCAAKLLERLAYLSGYAGGENTCEIHSDRAPMSFSLVMFRPDGTKWFNGGLIYSGPGQPLDGSSPALTVGIGIDSSVHGWSVHT